ncbi:MAG TPA: alpha/beta fold hydrolase [Longimicrobiaceae bacterium]|nr:alpha/beta fold hydrolase [Longimicrobiaceae bacterium]
MLLVHGYPLSGRLWDPVVERLRPEYRLIVPDLRGMGRSEVGDPVPLERYADDMVAVLDAVGVREPAVVVGLSMGGYIVLDLYRRHRGRVRAMVLADTRAAPDTPEAAAARRRSSQRAIDEGAPAVVGGMAEDLLAPGADAALREEWRGIMTATPPRGIASALTAMADRPDSRPLLPRIACPVLVIVGAEDTLTPPGQARRMAESIRGARLAVIPGAGHLTPVERPAEFALALRRFLEGIG